MPRGADFRRSRHLDLFRRASSVVLKFFELDGRAVIAVRVELPFSEFLEEELDSLGY